MTSQAKTSVTINDSAVADGQTIDAADVTVAFDDVQTELQEGWSRVSANDTNVKHLEDAITAGTGISITTNNDGADETLSIAVGTLASPTISSFANATHDHEDAAGGGQLTADAIDSETATNGYVLTADGTGGASWAAAAGGGAQPVDITVTAGEALSLRDYVFVDTSDGQAYKVDIDATPIKCGRLRGFVTESGGIASAGTGTVRILGEVTGFSGLTAWQPVYASATAGGNTQTKPSPTSGGAQVAIVPAGIATSTTAIMTLNQEMVQYMKRDSVADDGTLTITHHTDAQGYNRRLDAFISDIILNEYAEYTSGNQDEDVQLRGESGAGGTLDINATGQAAWVGDVNDSDIWMAQSFVPAASGVLTQLKVTLGANTGSPTGTIRYRIRTDNAGQPSSTQLITATFSPTPSSENTITVTGGPFLDGSTTYWLILHPTNTQSTNNRYSWQAQNSSTYANGETKYSANDGSTWLTNAAFADCEMEATTSAQSAKDKLAQSFEITGTQTIDRARLYLKKVGTPTGTMTLRIETDSAGEPSGTLADANATVTVAESTLTTSYALVDFDFATNFSLSGSTTYWLVLSTDRSASNSNYVLWGADGSTPSYADGEMQNEISSTWAAESKDAVFAVLGNDTIFVEPANGGFSTAGTTDGAPRAVFAHHDGTYGDPTTKSTVKNVSGGTVDLTFVVEVE